VVDVQIRHTGKDRLPYVSASLKFANLRLEQNRPVEGLRLASEVVVGLDRLEPLPRIERGFAGGFALAVGREAGAESCVGVRTHPVTRLPSLPLRALGAPIGSADSGASAAPDVPAATSPSPSRGLSSWTRCQT
jgi:hypothetical protein